MQVGVGVCVLSPSIRHEFPGVPQCAPPLPSIHAFQAMLHLLYLAYLAHLVYLHVSCLEEEAMIRGGGAAPGSALCQEPKGSTQAICLGVRLPFLEQTRCRTGWSFFLQLGGRIQSQLWWRPSHFLLHHQHRFLTPLV